MSSPFSNLSIPSPPVVNTGGGGLQDMLPMIMQMLQNSAQRKMRQAENTVGAIEPGRTAGSLTEQERKALKRARGKKVDPNSVVNPLEGEEGELSRSMSRLGITQGSSLWEGLMTGRAARLATGSPHALTTQQGLTDEQSATATQAATGRTVAEVGNQQAQSLKTGNQKITEGKGVDSLSEPEVLAYQRFNDITPSEGMAKSLEGSTKMAVMKEALRVANDPDSATWAKLMPPDVKPADVIAGIALGVGPMMLEGFQQRGQQALARSTRASEAEKALYGVAEDVSKKMGGRYSPIFIAAVMSGDPSVSNTPAGLMVQRFLDSGFYAGLMDTALKGDPGALAMKQLLEVAHIPQLAGNENLLAQYSNLLRGSMANSLTRAFMGVDRPSERGKDQNDWDAANKAIAKQMGGMFGTNWLGNLQVKKEPVGSEAESTEKERPPDKDIAREALEALYGPLGALGVKQGKTRVLGQLKAVTGAK